MFTWLPLANLPQVPQHFVNRALDIAKNPNKTNEISNHYNNPNQDYERRKLVRDGKFMNTRSLQGFSLGEDWEQWVRQNIVRRYHNTGLRVSVGKNTTTHGAHTDVIKIPTPKVYWKLYYLIDQGGNDTETVFYREIGMPIVRDDPTKYTITVDNFDQLEELERIRIPLHQWILLNTSVLHGVENITGARTNLTVMVELEDLDFGISSKLKD